MKKALFLSVTAALALCLVVLGSCASAPREKTDELDGTDWEFVYQAGHENYKFSHGGVYNWSSYISGFATPTKRNGTYTIEGDKIIFVRKADYSDVTLTATFSEDRKSFSYSDRVFVQKKGFFSKD